MTPARCREVQTLRARIEWLESRLEQRENVISALADRVASLRVERDPWRSLP